MINRRLVSMWAASLTLAIAAPAVVSSAGLAQTPTNTTALQTALDQAVCQQQWGRANILVSQLLNAPETSPTYRDQLIAYRQQLAAWQRQSYVDTSILGCDLVLATRDTPEAPVSSREMAVSQRQNQAEFNWDQEMAAMNRRLNGEEFADSPLILTQPPAPTVNNSPLLASAAAIAINQGQGAANGAVSTGHQLHRFTANAGDQISVTINVTEVRPGRQFTDDDTQLFLFNAQGQLLAENDDYAGFQSALMNISLPTTGDYFVAVTTFNNDPILNANGVLTGWPDDGGSDVSYTLNITGVSSNVASR